MLKLILETRRVLPAMLAVIGLQSGYGGNAFALEPTSDQVTCVPPTGEIVDFPTTKLFFEHNSTDEDTGVHGAFDSSSWSELCVYDPSGVQILAVKPQEQLRNLNMAGIFFESREPPNTEVSIADLMAQFPEGLYEARAVTFDGKGMVGAATFTHDIPAAPVITAPKEDAVVPSTSNLLVKWKPVTQTLSGGPITITGYEVIITKDVDDDPNGFSRPTFDVHLPPSVTRLRVPKEFLEPGSPYELEVLALEVSGNQTITVSFFETE